MNHATDYIPFARPSLGTEEEEAALRVLRSGWLTTGRETAAFETEFAAAVGARYALALNSATAGLHLALEALGVGPGDTVVTTPLTFTATAEVVRYLGAEVLFSDIAPNGYNLDSAALVKTLERARADGRRVKAVIPVHLAGEPCPMRRLNEIAAEFEVSLVEDAAHAFPVRSDDGRWTGTSGVAGVYSFYATKTITTGEGGMLVTDNPDLAGRIQIMRLHGIDRVVWDRYTSPASPWAYSVVAAGYKYNMTDLAAAIGREQLKKAATFLDRRREIAARYSEAFSRIVELQPPVHDAEHAWHIYILRLQPGLSDRRDTLIESLTYAGIGVSVHYIPLHIMPYYRDLYDLRPEQFPHALDAYSRSLSLPIYPGLTNDQVDRVIRAVENSLRR